MTWAGAHAFLRHELADALVVLDWSLESGTCDPVVLRGAADRAALVLAGLRLLGAGPGDRARSWARLTALLPAVEGGYAPPRPDLWAAFLSEAVPGCTAYCEAGVLVAAFAAD